MSSPSPSPGPLASSIYELRRQIASILPDEGGEVSEGAPLELSRNADLEPPHIAAASPLEAHAIRRHRVEGDPTVAFAAFLDGTQESHVVRFAGGLPIVAATVGAVVRVRRNRRHLTWQHLVRHHVCAPLRAIGAAWRGPLLALGDRFRDTSDAVLGSGSPAGALLHPYSVSDAAVHAVQRERETLERQLGRAWCRGGGENQPLFIDGSIAGDDRIAAAACAVGVVKSHRVLYGGADVFRVVLDLDAGERSTVTRIESAHAKRTAVASWYLRLRDPRGHDPLWGLVRIETALPAAGGPNIAAHADLVSRWVLAEGTPLALPDGRWDKMTYGIRDCEEFLRAVR
jgi:hypothetical protein